MIETISSLLKAHGEKLDLDDFSKKSPESISKQKKSIQPTLGDNPLEEDDEESFPNREIDRFGPEEDNYDQPKEEVNEELLNKVAEWIYHESSEPISEIEYLLKKSGAVGEYMDAVSENKEKVTEGTWSIPDTPEKVKELKDLMKQELPAAGAHDKIYHLLGDDELFDELDAMEEKDPTADVRGMIVRRLDDLGLLKKDK